MERPSRLDLARKRVRIARYVLGAAAAGAFGALAVVARAAHPGTHSRQSTVESTVSNESSQLQTAGGVLDSGSGGSVSSAPAGSAPVVQSGGS